MTAPRATDPAKVARDASRHVSAAEALARVGLPAHRAAPIVATLASAQAALARAMEPDA